MCQSTVKIIQNKQTLVEEFTERIQTKRYDSKRRIASCRRPPVVRGGRRGAEGEVLEVLFKR